MARGKTYQQIVNQYARIQDGIRERLGSNGSNLIMRVQRTRSSRKNNLLARLDRANNIFNRYTRNINNAGVFERDSDNNAANYQRDANKIVSRRTYMGLNGG